MRNLFLEPLAFSLVISKHHSSQGSDMGSPPCVRADFGSLRYMSVLDKAWID